MFLKMNEKMLHDMLPTKCCLHLLLLKSKAIILLYPFWWAIGKYFALRHLPCLYHMFKNLDDEKKLENEDPKPYDDPGLY